MSVLLPAKAQLLEGQEFFDLFNDFSEITTEQVFEIVGKMLLPRQFQDIVDAQGAVLIVAQPGDFDHPVGYAGLGAAPCWRGLAAAGLTVLRQEHALAQRPRPGDIEGIARTGIAHGEAGDLEDGVEHLRARGGDVQTETSCNVG